MGGFGGSKSSARHQLKELLVLMDSAEVAYLYHYLVWSGRKTTAGSKDGIGVLRPCLPLDLSAFYVTP